MSNDSESQRASLAPNPSNNHSHSPSPLPLPPSSVLYPSLSTLVSNWHVKAKQTRGHSQTQIGKSGRHSKGEMFCWISLYFFVVAEVFLIIHNADS